MSTIWVTADHHLSRARIIEYCARPFSSVEEMDAELIRRWNEAVRPDDLVVHLGDFAVASTERIRELVAQLRTPRQEQVDPGICFEDDYAPSVGSTGRRRGCGPAT